MKETLKNLAKKKLLWGIVIMVTCQIQGALPVADFLPPLVLKIVSFVIGLFLTGAKGVEMFYQKSEDLEKTSDVIDPSSEPKP